MARAQNLFDSKESPYQGHSAEDQGRSGQAEEGPSDEVRTDTLQLCWGAVDFCSANGKRSWKHLISTQGQSCVLKWDALARVRSFKYLGEESNGKVLRYWRAIFCLFTNSFLATL